MPIMGDEIDWDEVYYWLNTIVNECSQNLSAWETKFIGDMCERADNKLYLTRSQRNKIKEIYEEKTR